MSIGIQLRQAREAQSLSLDEAAQATRIKLHYLEALEADQFDSLPSAAQLRGFLRAYADYLKVNSAELIASLEKDSTSAPALPVPSSPANGISQPSNADAIFTQLGHTLQSQRELMGLSLGEVERHTHIRIHYIRALEEGDISHLPSPVQGRGMLSNYASFLGLDTESVLLRFADGLQASLYDRQAARSTSARRSGGREPAQAPVKPSQFKRLFSMDLFVGGFLIIFLLGFTIWGAMRISKLNTGRQTSPTAPPVSEILLSTPGNGVITTAELTPGTQASTLAATFVSAEVLTATLQVDAFPTLVAQPTPGNDNAPLQLYVVAVQRAWMRITVDGEVAFEGRVMPGSAYSFSGTQRLELLTGDAAGLQVVFNQQNLGFLGGFGEVVDRIFSIEGIQTATPSVPSTSTPVPTSSATSTPTPTPTSTVAIPTPTRKP